MDDYSTMVSFFDSPAVAERLKQAASCQNKKFTVLNFSIQLISFHHFSEQELAQSLVKQRDRRLQKCHKSSGLHSDTGPQSRIKLSLMKLCK